MKDSQKTYIENIARHSVSLDGHAIADSIEEEAAGQANGDDLTNRHRDELRAVAAVCRGLGNTIHPLDWNPETLAVSPAVTRACGGRFDPREIAKLTLVWLAEIAAAQVNDIVTGDVTEKDFLKDRGISDRQLDTLESITGLLHEVMKID